MKTTVHKDELSAASSVQSASATVLVPMLNLGQAPAMVEIAATLAAGLAQGDERRKSKDESTSRRPSFASSGPILRKLRTHRPSSVVINHSAIRNLQSAIPRVVVLGVVEVPPEEPLTTGLDMARSYRALLDFLPSQVDVAGRHVRVDHVVKVARDVPSAVREAAAGEHASMVLFYWKGYARESKKHVYGRTLDEVLSLPPCDVVLVRPEGWHEARRLLLPVRGGPTAERALALALIVAERLHLPLTVMHSVPAIRAKGPGPTAQGREEPGAGMNAMRSPEPGHGVAEAFAAVEALGEEPYLVFNEYLEAVRKSASVPVERILTLSDDPAAALLAEAQSDDLVIMGSAEPRPGASVPAQVAEVKGPPMLIVRTPGGLDLAGYTQKARARRGSRSSLAALEDISFEHWFVEHTYHADEFKDPEEFLKAKRASGLSLSVALLTFNDAERIYSMITGLKKVLVEMHPIADQIAVIDGGSSDDTVEIARSLGVDVYRAEELLPSQGHIPGRGESWWKSLAVLWGDVLVWLDPRARRFHPSTAMALAGPLLRHPGLQLVKAFAGAHPDAKHKGPPNGGKEREGFAPVDMSWGGFIIPRREEEQGSQRIRVQALKPADLQALAASQLAMLPPRTILQVLSPSLAGVIAPFGRDMAGRRQAMLSVPAFTGEQVDVGVLLSVAAEHGTRAIAQVELRHAQPRPLLQPGLRNALDTLQVLARRVPDAAMRQCAAQVADRLQREIEGAGASPDEVFEVRALDPVERPPMGDVLRDA